MGIGLDVEDAERQRLGIEQSRRDTVPGRFSAEQRFRPALLRRGQHISDLISRNLLRACGHSPQIPPPCLPPNPSKPSAPGLELGQIESNLDLPQSGFPYPEP